nr:hypothetical protein pmam_99 [Pithovirus mammoth]
MFELNRFKLGCFGFSLKKNEKSELGIQICFELYIKKIISSFSREILSKKIE